MLTKHDGTKFFFKRNKKTKSIFSSIFNCPKTAHVCLDFFKEQFRNQKWWEGKGRKPQQALQQLRFFSGCTTLMRADTQT